MKNFARISGILLGVFGLFLITVFAFGIAPGGLAAGLTVSIIGLLLVSLTLDKPGPLQETDSSISGKRLAAFILIGIFSAVLFKFGFEGLTLYPALVLIGILIAVALVFGMATWLDIKEIMKLVNGDKSIEGSAATPQ